MDSDKRNGIELKKASDDLARRVRRCELCRDALPLGPRPVVQFSHTSKMLIIGQAPGLKVHNSGIPFNDPSGVRLRQWLNLAPERFYDPAQVAIIPMGFCYPGRGRNGDNPPDPRCAPLWHRQIRAMMPQIELTLLVGQYAQRHYLEQFDSVTQSVRRWRTHLERGMIALPHPSPRNNLWLRRNPWFEAELIAPLQQRVAAALGDG
ncbi:uracil-DNA glycosylase family protein [Ferrimonas sediminicola]|uniref:Uracil-DNA glycosylase family protein n=1 Tax=Ferrimonas sediminicola TaxID=2569538 RepID=A0A4U1BKG1_9GAMM|nr:uracil-DNA glycosylase family protein [Ferrimonas sediminicola]TKB51304.1 uracil-DNA glycosylase family protein [Ferrimonas sediminicola]